MVNSKRLLSRTAITGKLETADGKVLELVGKLETADGKVLELVDKLETADGKIAENNELAEAADKNISELELDVKEKAALIDQQGKKIVKLEKKVKK